MNPEEHGILAQPKKPGPIKVLVSGRTSKCAEKSALKLPFP